MTKMKSFLFVLIAATLLFALSCSDESSGSSPEPDSNKLTYLASTQISDYTQRAMKTAGLASTNSTDSIPQVYIVNGSDLASLSDDKILLAVKTCLEGQTFIIDAPDGYQIYRFVQTVQTLLEKDENKYWYDQTDIHPWSILSLLCQFYNQTEENDETFEAIAMRKEQMYFVHDIDQVMDVNFEEESEVITSAATEGNPTEEADEIDTNENSTSDNKETDFTTVTAASIQAFAEWIKSNDTEESSGQRAAASTIEEEKEAQSFVHNFTASFSYTGKEKYPYNGRYDGKCENVQLYTDVWTACSIDTNTDYYLVRTSAVCNNQQLGYKNEWDNGKHIGPYMRYCEITSKLGNGYASLKANKCSPGTTTGTSSFTQGQSFSFSGNVGFNSSGPTGGLTTGFSINASRTQSIPDISVSFNLADDSKSATWKFEAPNADTGWDGLYTYGSDAKGIQTKTAIFDTYAVYTMPSYNYWVQERVPLNSDAKVRLAATAAYLDGFFYTNLNTYRYYKTTPYGFTDYVRKPCNSFCNYIMYFDPPSDITPERRELYNSILKDYITDWNSSQRYYGFCDTSKTWTYERHNKIAASYFSTAEKTIRTNQDVLKSRGFKGTFTFRIKNATTGEQIRSFDLTF